jgi:hypothetical protein
MKKMMTLLAAVLVAGITQAAVMNWQSGAIYLPTSAADGTWNTAGGTAYRVPGGTASPVTAYFFLLTAEEYGNASLIGDVTAAMQAGTYNLAAADNSMTPSSMARITNWANQGDYAVGESGYMLAIWTLDAYDGSFNQDWFMVTTAMGTIADNGANAFIQNMASNIGTWTAVPEPTSMALLALGVAALGLRRKFRA